MYKKEDSSKISLILNYVYQDYHFIEIIYRNIYIFALLLFSDILMN